MKLRVNQKSMLEIIDTNFSRLAEPDRTQVSRHFNSMPVRRLHCGLQLRMRDIHVGLE